MYINTDFLHRLLSSLLLILALGTTVNVPASDKLNITIYGASGMIGSRIAKEALDRGHSVMGIARDISKIEIEHENFRAVAGDVTDPNSVMQALAGQDVVVSAVGGLGPTDPQQAIEYRAAKTLINALQKLAAQGPRIIVVGGASTLEIKPGVTSIDEKGVPEGKMGAMIMGHKLALDAYRASEGIRWTVLTPSFRIRPGERTGKFRLGTESLLLDAEGNSTSISVEDYAVAMVDEMEDPGHIGKRFTVGY